MNVAMLSYIKGGKVKPEGSRTNSQIIEMTIIGYLTKTALFE
jgi:hypothetical protein